MLLLAVAAGLAAQEEGPSVIADIRIEGLQRVSAGNVFTSLPLRVGDPMEPKLLRDAARALFRTGNFEDLEIGRDGDVLIIRVVERPSIWKIEVEGNRILPTDSLLDGLARAGLAEGAVFQQSTLQGIQGELRRQYVSQGHHYVDIQVELEELPRSRVAILIQIDEGKAARVRGIRIIGNRQFEDKVLLDLFETRPAQGFSTIGKSSRYSREKLGADLEILNSFYLDRGYAGFLVESVQVTVTPAKDAVYITVNVKEGPRYRIDEVRLAGDLKLPEEEVRELLPVQPGQYFSQLNLARSENAIRSYLGDRGYLFAQVSASPEIQEETGVVTLRFLVEPGALIYIRRINFEGHTTSADDVLRQELRQMEGAPASGTKIDQSRLRLNRLGYFRGVNVQTSQVPGAADQIDLNFVVDEFRSGSIGASIGYSEDSGLLVSANLTQDNFLGTGRRVEIGVNRTEVRENYLISYLEPYYDEHGISRGISVFFRSTELDELDISNYSTESYGSSLSFGYPLSETQRVNFSISYADTKIIPGVNSAFEIRARTVFYSPGAGCLLGDEELTDTECGLLQLVQAGQPVGFIDEQGDEFDSFSLSASWSESSLNRGLLPTAGHSQSLVLELSVPGSDLEFYKLSYRGQVYFPMGERATLHFRTRLGYGDGYGDLDKLPFFENFFAGGLGSVRGFRGSTLGPRTVLGAGFRRQETNSGPYVAIDDDGDGTPDRLILEPNPGTSSDAIGGNIVVEGTAEVLFQPPFIQDDQLLRFGVFLDAGNVFDSNCTPTQINCSDIDFDELRYTAGIGISWITALAPLTFSYAWALKDEPEDETDTFTFSFGQFF